MGDIAKEVVYFKKFIIDLAVVLMILDLIPLLYDKNRVIVQEKEPMSHQKS